MRPAIKKPTDQRKKTSLVTESNQPELLFIIAPPPHICSDVAVLKDDVHYLIGHTFADRFSKAHISLLRYADEYAEDMIEFVEEKAAGFQPFNVFLKDFGVFQQGNNRSIYMDIVNKYAICEIFENLVKTASDFTPHISIARNLAAEDFLKCWPYLKGLNYSNQHFVCDRITVLHHNGKKWIHLKDILFGD
ncbi:2'-5' RNA ligase family protein [Oscillatoria amoena NRMC-F 0135]|nr:2'-5' RNA ligase family protein [Oscillatoria amoena NRMC-F 0135]